MKTKEETKAMCIEGAGQTTTPTGALKEMTDEQLKTAQKARQTQSGIAPKEGGSLTMPAKWRGVVPDRNSSWADFTNYAFPIHDLAHANNAAARLAQSAGVYSEAEKAKMQKRIENAQKKFAKASIISLDAMDLESIKADMLEPKSEPVTREELNSIFSAVIDVVRRVADRCSQRDNGIVDACNEWMSDHTMGHLPSLDGSQKMALFKAAGIDDQIEPEMTPMNCNQRGIWASSLPSDQIEKLNSIKINVK